MFASRPPGTPVLDEVFSVENGKAFDQLSNKQVVQDMFAAWASPVFEDYLEDDNYPPKIKQALEVFRSQMGETSLTPTGSKECLAIAKGGRIQASIMGIAGTKERARGETLEKMKQWKEFTSGDFSLSTVDADHMMCMRDKQLIERVVGDLQQFL